MKKFRQIKENLKKDPDHYNNEIIVIYLIILIAGPGIFSCIFN